VLKISDVGPQVNPEEIGWIEGVLGSKLPEDYKQFLLKYNGGVPEDDEIAVEELDDTPTDLRVFFGIRREEETENIFWNLNLVKESCKGMVLLPFACDSGGNLFLLQWKGNNFSVVYLDTGEVWKLYYVAKSFGEFLNLLKPYEN
jgi:hypothetical protein